MEDWYERKRNARADYIAERTSEYINANLGKIVEDYEDEIIEILKKKDYKIIKESEEE